MACVNPWFWYRRHCDQKNEKYRNLLDFVCDIAAGLLKRETNGPRKRGHLSDSLKPGPSKKRVEKAPCPVADVHYNGVGHWPEHLANTSRGKLYIKVTVE
jgi:hypothetical protein